MKNQATNNIWLVSRGFDSCVFLIPIALALLVTPIGFWYYPAQIPLWAFIFVIITFDVAHVWATAYRVYLDKDEFQRRFWFYFLPLPAFFFLALGLCCYDMTLYWTLLAYTAIFHFIKQPYGFVAIYKQKLHERCKLDYYLDKWAVWCAGLGPVILWHGSPQRVFDWFNAGESFLLKVPPSILPYVTFFYGLTLVFYVGRQLYLYKTTKFVNHGKNLVMMGTWLTWALGIAISNPLVSAAYLNLFHGIPFFAVVWLYGTNKWTGENARKNTILNFAFKQSNLFYFFLLVFIPSLLEEGLWDGFIWHTYLPPEFHFQMSSFFVAFWIALLSLPQIIHYWLDAFIWKFNGSNPDLKQHLGL